MIAKTRLIAVSAAVFISFHGISAAATLWPFDMHFERNVRVGGVDGRVETQIGPVSFTVAEGGGKPLSDLIRVISVGMKRGCIAAHSPGNRSPMRPLVMVWRLRKEGPRPVFHINAELFSRGRSVASAFTRTISPDGMPRVVFEYDVAQLTCSLFRKAGYVCSDSLKGLSD